MSEHAPQVHHDVLEAGQSLLLVLVVALFATTFIMQAFRTPSESMEPTLKVGDFYLVNKQAFAPRGVLDAVLPPSPVRRGDVMVFHYPVDPSIHVVKRVVGLPGDRLRLREGKLILNGRPVDEPYAFYAASIPDNFRDNFPAPHRVDGMVDPQWFHTMQRNVRDGELYIPDGRYFVMGDNRNDSEDSRYWGFVPQAEVVGRPVAVFFTVGTEGVGWKRGLVKALRSMRLVR